MDTSTLIPANFQLFDTNTSTFIPLTNPVYSNTNMTVTFTPATPLNPQSIYEIIIPTPANVTNTCGVPLVSGGIISTFTTITPIVFITTGTYTGNFGGVSGADVICQTEAYASGTIIPHGLTFKAILVTSGRYPCSSQNGGVSGQCGGSFENDWPLIPGVKYFNPDLTVFNTVNAQSVFDGSNDKLQLRTGIVTTPSQVFWTGIQSILSNNAALDIVGWAYTDMNSAADGTTYASESPANCLEFTSTTGGGLQNGSNTGFTGFPPTVILGTITGGVWGNYETFSDSGSALLLNVWSIGETTGCTSLLQVTCASNS